MYFGPIHSLPAPFPCFLVSFRPGSDPPFLSLCFCDVPVSQACERTRDLPPCALKAWPTIEEMDRMSLEELRQNFDGWVTRLIVFMGWMVV